MVVEWAPLYTVGEKPRINIYSVENENALNSIKILMLSDMSSDGKVTLTTNGGGYMSDSPNESQGTFFLMTLLTNHTDKKVSNIHFDIRVVLNSTG